MKKIEELAQAMEGELSELGKKMDGKVDRDYIDKRINELVSLVSKKK